MKDADALLGIVEDAVRRAQAAGAHEAEAFVKESHVMRVSCHGDLASPTESHSIGIGMRVLIDGAIGVAASAGLHRLDTVVDDAIDAARSGRAREGFPGLPQAVDSGMPPTPVPDAFTAPDPEHLQHAVRTVIDALKHPRMEFQTVTFGVGASRFAVANSNGLATWDQGGRATYDLELRAGGGHRPVTAWDTRSRSAPMDLDTDLVAPALAARERALGAARPRALDAPANTVVLGAAASAQVLSRFLRALNGSLVARGESPLTDAIGTNAASSLLSIRDVPHGDAGPQRRRVDHEGVPTQSIDLVREGVLTGTYDDTLSGIGRHGSNGHGVRRGWSGAIAPGLLTPMMRPGRGSLDDLVADADDAVLIEEPLTGMLTANIGTGQFSAVLPFAYRIEGGEVTHALPNVTVSGNVLEVAQQIQAVGGQAHESQLGFYCPIRTGGITCAT